MSLIIFIDGSQFSLLFFSVFFGATIITFNTRVLGGNISYFQSVSVLGYCLFPLFLSTLLLQILRLIQFNNSLVRFIAISVSCLWCIVGTYLVLFFSCKSIYICECIWWSEVCSDVSVGDILCVFGSFIAVYVMIYCIVIFL
jgi:hypothetical protein